MPREFEGGVGGGGKEPKIFVHCAKELLFCSQFEGLS